MALKVLPDEARRQSGTLARFQLEAQAGMRLNHPNIVRSYAPHKTEDIYGTIYYVVMELVRGINLFELLVLKRKLDPAQACDIIVQAASALDYARSGIGTSGYQARESSRAGRWHRQDPRFRTRHGGRER